MQFVNPAHQNQIGSQGRLRQIVDAATADSMYPGLAADGQFVVTVGYCFPLNSPALHARLLSQQRRAALWSRVLRCHFTNLGMQAFDIDNRLCCCLATLIKDIRHSVEQLIFPLLDLVWMNVELLGKLDHRFLALDRD